MQAHFYLPLIETAIAPQFTVVPKVGCAKAKIGWAGACESRHPRTAPPKLMPDTRSDTTMVWPRKGD
jgi:hypothetical protein